MRFFTGRKLNGLLVPVPVYLAPEPDPSQPLQVAGVILASKGAPKNAGSFQPDFTEPNFIKTVHDNDMSDRQTDHKTW